MFAPIGAMGAFAALDLEPDLFRDSASIVEANSTGINRKRPDPFTPFCHLSPHRYFNIAGLKVLTVQFLPNQLGL
jgi:hypothetical protein